jgi:16S rRNA (guanine(966)-N(2))-methyltransferase RsmD
VREAIFDILGERVAGTSVLDLFAGSGALGLEALSRGASRAVFVESDTTAYNVLRRNVEALGAAEAETILLDYRQALRRLRARSMRFDLVFIDPPYSRGLSADSTDAIRRAGLVPPGGTIVVEEARRAADVSFPEGWARSDDRLYGDTRVMLFEVSA